MAKAKPARKPSKSPKKSVKGQGSSKNPGHNDGATDQDGRGRAATSGGKGGKSKSKSKSPPKDKAASQTKPKGKSKSPPKKRQAPNSSQQQDVPSRRPSEEQTNAGPQQRNLPNSRRPSVDQSGFKNRSAPASRRPSIQVEPQAEPEAWDGEVDPEMNAIMEETRRAIARDQLLHEAEEREAKRLENIRIKEAEALEGAKGALARRTKVLEPPRQELPSDVVAWARHSLLPASQANEQYRPMDPLQKLQMEKRLIQNEREHVEKSVYNRDYMGAASHRRLADRALGSKKTYLIDGGEGNFVKEVTRYIKDDVVEPLKELEVSEVMNTLKNEKRLMENAMAFCTRPEGSEVTRYDKNKVVAAFKRFTAMLEENAPKMEFSAEGRAHIGDFTSYHAEIQPVALNFIAEESIEAVEKHRELLGSCFVYGKTSSAVKAYERFIKSLESHKAILLQSEVGKKYIEDLRDFVALRQDMINDVRFDYITKELERERKEVELAVAKEIKGDLDAVVNRNYALALLRNLLKELHLYELQLRESRKGKEYLDELRKYAREIREKYKEVRLHGTDETSDTYIGLQIDGMLRHIDSHSPSFEQEDAGADVLMELLSPKKKWERRRSQILALEGSPDKTELRKRDRMAVTKKIERSDGQQRGDAADWSTLKVAPEGR